jgi:hypothetical protein
MDCYPPCKTCTGLCHETPKSSVRFSSARRVTIPQKHGTTELTCGHTVPLSEITLTVLGDGLGAQPYCDRCGDFRPAKKTTKKKRTALAEEPMF